MYLIASAQVTTLNALGDLDAKWWRGVRRFNLPVQLALASAERIVPCAADVRTALVVSLAPCQQGSAELYGWGRRAIPIGGKGAFMETRMNPTHTLHAVDNLALSAFAIAHENRAHCIGLGGAPGQAWVALEAVDDRLRSGCEMEAFILAGDQESIDEAGQGLGVALLFSHEPRLNEDMNRIVEIGDIHREPSRNRSSCRPHSARGLARMISSSLSQDETSSHLRFEVPEEDGDGIDLIEINMHMQTETAMAGLLLTNM